MLEDFFDPAVWGKIPSEIDVNDYIWFALAADMNLYDDNDEEDEEEEEDDDDED